MTSTQKLIGGAAVVLAIVAIVIATRKEDPPKTTTTTADTTEKREPSTPTTTAQPTRAAEPSSSAPAPIVSGAPVDVSTLAQEAKTVEAARAALRAGDPKKALVEIERYERIPNGGSLKQEATILKIEALSKSGRKTDALALGMSTRDDPTFAPYRERVDSALTDAGLIGPTPPPIAP